MSELDITEVARRSGVPASTLRFSVHHHVRDDAVIVANEFIRAE